MNELTRCSVCDGVFEDLELKWLDGEQVCDECLESINDLRIEHERQTRMDLSDYYGSRI